MEFFLSSCLGTVKQLAEVGGEERVEKWERGRRKIKYEPRCMPNSNPLPHQPNSLCVVTLLTVVLRVLPYLLKGPCVVETVNLPDIFSGNKQYLKATL